MRTIFFYCTILICWLVWIPAGQAQLEVTATLDSTRMLIGDQVNIRLDANMPAGAKNLIADLSVLEKTEGLEIINSRQLWDTITSGGRVNFSKNIVITIFENGSFFIPSIPFTADLNGQELSAQTRELLMEIGTVGSVVDESKGTNPVDTTSLAEIKPIIEEPFKLEDIAPLLITLLLIALIGGLIYYFYQRSQKGGTLQKLPPKITTPAHLTALQKLKELKGAQLWQQGDIKTYQTQLTFIVREYLENRYQIAALESTTHEIIKDLQPIRLSDEWKGKLREMLELADLVKFAKASPPEETHERLMGYAESFVETTKLVPVDPAPEIAQKNNNA